MGWEIRQGDALEQLAKMEASSVQTCITSPPYFGLRDYGTGEWEGGDEGCDHGPERQPRTERPRAGLTGGLGQVEAQDAGSAAFRDVCGKCGARRTDQQVGLEQTPDAYVARLVEVFREVRRVLRDDGTLWLNLGDSYAGSWGNQGRKPERGNQRPINGDMLTPVLDGRYPDKGSNTGALPPGYKQKDLLGIPWQVAFALRTDGWYLRSDIIWSKPNPMPESVTDRPTKAHEYLFLLSKQPRYFWDADAIREDAAESSVERADRGYNIGGSMAPGRGDEGPIVRPFEAAGRNKRSVWTIPTQPFPGAHFAVFPPKLIEPCVLAGSAPTDLVLDPFAGAGTTGLVALQHGRTFIGIELNPDYVKMATDRIATAERLGFRSPDKGPDPLPGQEALPL